MNLLTIENLSKSYTERKLFDHADFSIQEMEKIGVIGINGMGKSTLLKIVAGVETPDEGNVIMGNNIRIGYLPQNPVEDGTIRDQARILLNKLERFEPDTPYEKLSGGQRKCVALANILTRDVDILVLDEPTNHLDNAMSEWLEEFLIAYKGALLMVTHDRYFLDRVSTRIVEVDKGQIYSYPGNYSEFVRLKETRQNMELSTERKRQSILRTELEWLARGARARSTKQKAHIARIEEMQAKSAPIEDGSVEINSLSTRMGRKTIEVNGISKTYGDKVLFQDYSYIFLKGERIGIVGPNGCGKSTLLKVIDGFVEPDSGFVDIGQTVKIGYFSQENEAMDESMKVIEYVRTMAEYIQTKDGSISASQMLERFLFDGSMQWTQISKLSGGEKRRLYLLYILMGAPNVLILDEPTNDLDIQTLTILEDYLDTFDGIVITVSHDRYFLDRVVRRVFAFEENGHIQQYEGGYSDYLNAYELRHSPESEIKATEKKDKPKVQRSHEQKLKFTFKEAKEYETIDEDIADLEDTIADCDKQMLANASDYGKLKELTEKKEDAEKQLEEKMDRWVYLNDLAEQIQQQNQ
ncbi:MAG: ABC-F family ATP-binding cassette domain-containing protein [Lachnospiraceae bacterium]|nr:ABC-F family ATP-binding cassette domain-containing protein [Lachnospiraceae bacterium]